MIKKKKKLWHNLIVPAFFIHSKSLKIYFHIGTGINIHSVVSAGSAPYRWDPRHKKSFKINNSQGIKSLLMATSVQSAVVSAFIDKIK